MNKRSSGRRVIVARARLFQRCLALKARSHFGSSAVSLLALLVSLALNIALGMRVVYPALLQEDVLRMPEPIAMSAP